MQYGTLLGNDCHALLICEITGPPCSREGTLPRARHERVRIAPGSAGSRRVLEGHDRSGNHARQGLLGLGVRVSTRITLFKPVLELAQELVDVRARVFFVPGRFSRFVECHFVFLLRAPSAGGAVGLLCRFNCRVAGSQPRQYSMAYRFCLIF